MASAAVAVVAVTDVKSATEQKKKQKKNQLPSSISKEQYNLFNKMITFLWDVRDTGGPDIPFDLVKWTTTAKIPLDDVLIELSITNVNHLMEYAGSKYSKYGCGCEEKTTLAEMARGESKTRVCIPFVCDKYFEPCLDAISELSGVLLKDFSESKHSESVRRGPTKSRCGCRWPGCDIIPEKSGRKETPELCVRHSQQSKEGAKPPRLTYVFKFQSPIKHRDIQPKRAGWYPIYQHVGSVVGVCAYDVDVATELKQKHPGIIDDSREIAWNKTLKCLVFK